MSVEKMKFVALSAKADRYFDVMDKCISGTEVEFVDAYDMYKKNNIALLTVINNIEQGEDSNAQYDHTIYRFYSKNPYADEVDKIKKFLAEYKDKSAQGVKNENFDTDKEFEKLCSLNSKIEMWEDRKAKNDLVISQLEPIKDSNISLDEMSNMKYIKGRFGRMTRQNFEKVLTFLDDLDIIYSVVNENKDYIWLWYFVPGYIKQDADAIFKSLYFERIHISNDVYGMTSEAYDHFIKIRKETEDNLKSAIAEKNQYLSEVKTGVLSRYELIRRKYEIYEAGHYAVRDGEKFYICFWIPQSGYEKFEKTVNRSKEILIKVIDSKDIRDDMNPPVKLKNAAPFRPFEWFVKMFSLPSYNEFDPTVFLAITYVIIFGVMFGDAGHGLCLSLIGMMIYKKTKSQLGLIMIPLGMMSILFGFMYGSLFGFEDILPAILIRPMENSNTINLMLYSTIALGGVIILISMGANIVNGIIQKDVKRIFFSQNSFAGIVLYGGIFAGIISMVMGKSLFSPLYIVLVIVVPLLVIFFQDPLTILVTGKKGEKFSMVENTFEFIEILLSFVTNTISFVRVGAFALNHAGMISVVFVISRMFSTAGSWITIVLGNILVMVLEGLVVGIQVLRLEFFEMFSRYYTGGGREFRPTKIN